MTLLTLLLRKCFFLFVFFYIIEKKQSSNINSSIKKTNSWPLRCDCGFISMIESNDGINNTIITQCRGGTLSRIHKDFDAVRCRTPAQLLIFKYIHLKYLHYGYVGASNDLILINFAFRANKRRNNNINSNNSNRRWNVFTTNTIIALLMSSIRSKHSLDFVITKNGTMLMQHHKIVQQKKVQ